VQIVEPADKDTLEDRVVGRHTQVGVGLVVDQVKRFLLVVLHAVISNAADDVDWLALDQVDRDVAGCECVVAAPLAVGDPLLDRAPGVLQAVVVVVIDGTLTHRHHRPHR